LDPISGFDSAAVAIAPRPRRSRRSMPRRKGPRGKAEIDRERRELWEQTSKEVDEIVAQFHAQLPRQKATSVGCVYARYSTRHQDSVADQIRTILIRALELGIFVPRENIHFDLAIRGFKRDRQGLNEIRDILRQKRAGGLLLFATNRLFRKTYLTLQFVDQAHKGWGVRCIFVKSGIDTDDAKRWEAHLAVHAMMDQFVVGMNVDQVRAAHEGLLEKRLVFGTLSYGYVGIPIDGCFTSRNRPRCSIGIDPETATIVRQVFKWYVEHSMPIGEIIRRLNDDPNIPLPPRCTSGGWTRSAVRGILSNSRYRGLWRYGVTEAVFLPDADYVQQRVRAQPLREIQFKELRILTDGIWYAAQIRISTDKGQRGRKPTNGATETYSKLLNGVLWCQEHDRPLQVGGPAGNSFVCPNCRGIVASKRPLFSYLNRTLATELTCAKLAEIITADEALINEVISACRDEIATIQEPDPKRLAKLRDQQTQLARSMDFTRRHVGITAEEQDESAKALAGYRNDWNRVTHEITAEVAARACPAGVPTDQQIRDLLRRFSEILRSAPASRNITDMAEARQIIELMTGGRIRLFQQGERSAQRGWLQGRFDAPLVAFPVAQSNFKCSAFFGEDFAGRLVSEALAGTFVQ